MPPVSAIPEHSEGSNRVQVMFGFRSSDRVAPGPSRIASPFPSRQVFSKTQRFSPRDARDGGRKWPAYNAPPDSDFKLVSAGVGETKAGTSDKSATGRFLSRCATRPCKAPRRGAGPSWVGQDKGRGVSSSSREVKRTAPLGCRPLDPEIVDPLSRFEVCCQPARLLSSTRPSLRRLVRIPEFRNNDRIGAASSLSLRLPGLNRRIKLPQPIFDDAYLVSQLRNKRLGDFLAKRP